MKTIWAVVSLSLLGCEVANAPATLTRKAQALVTPSTNQVCRVTADITGKADATDAFEEALACSTKNGLIPTVVPRGTYVLTRKLTVPPGVQLMGEPRVTLPPAGDPAGLPPLPVLDFPGGFADDAIELKDRATLSGLHIRFKAPQKDGKGAVRVTETGSSVQRVRITNASLGVYSPPGVNVGRVYLNQIHVVDSNIGVWIDLGLDVAKFENITVERATVGTSTYGVIFGRVDFMIASKINVLRADVGLEFRDAADAANPGGSTGSLSDFHATGGRVGLSVRGGAQVSATALTLSTTTGPAMAISDNATVSLASGKLTSEKASAVTVKDTSSLTMTAVFIDRRPPAFGEHGIDITSARALVLTGNVILTNNGYGVLLRNAVPRGVISGNSFEILQAEGTAIAGPADGMVISGNSTNR